MLVYQLVTTSFRPRANARGGIWEEVSHAALPHPPPRFLADARNDLRSLLRDDDLDTPILLASLARLVRGHGLRLPQPVGGESAAFQTVRGEPGHDRLRALLR